MTRPDKMRLPGTVAEVMASPAGPHIGAFFDLDGTLVAGFTGVIMTQEQFLARQMGIGDFIAMIQAGLNHQLGRAEFEDLIGTAARAMRGRSLSDLDEMGERLFRQKIEAKIYPEMRDLVRAHMDRGHTVCLSSSALTIQVEPVARHLGITNMLTNRFVVDDHGTVNSSINHGNALPVTTGVFTNTGTYRKSGTGSPRDEGEGCAAAHEQPRARAGRSCRGGVVTHRHHRPRGPGRCRPPRPRRARA